MSESFLWEIAVARENLPNYMDSEIGQRAVEIVPIKPMDKICKTYYTCYGDTSRIISLEFCFDWG